MESKTEASVPQQEGKAKEQMTAQRLHEMVGDEELSTGVWLPLSLNEGVLCRPAWQADPRAPRVMSLRGHRGGFCT